MPTPSPVAQVTGSAQAPGTPKASRFRLASQSAAVVLGGLTLASTAAVVVLASLTHDPQAVPGAMPAIVVALAFATVGFMVARRQPRNAIGWALLAVALCALLGSVGTKYSVIDYRLAHGSLPLGWLAVGMGVLWVPWLVLMALPLLLFPAGKLPSPRWRWSLWVYAIAGGFATVTALAGGVGIGIGRHVHIGLNGSPTNNVNGVLSVLVGAADLGALIVLALALIWTVRLLASYRRSTGDRRQQLKWLMGGGIVTIIAAVLIFVAPPDSAPSGIEQWALNLVFFLGFAGLPVGLGVGVLKYRLYDIDRLISRTLSYAIVTGILIGVYVGLVTLATRVLPFSSPLGVAASTLVAVALFSPLRRRVQRLVDRRFNRARYDAEATIEDFSHRLREDVDLEVVASEFVLAVQTSMEPAHVSLWLRPTGSRG